MIDIRRLWRRGRRRGTAEGVGVFGAPGFADDLEGLAALLGRHESNSQDLWMGVFHAAC